ncbi:uncharacterized protein [Cicer arietinum]|uniref:uncharacterized protein isoform X4 n=1 Tax=Cicer arietinum TaxID=3827 RepID=UPI003CC546C1
MATQVSCDVDYVTTLQARVKELEAENANLLSRLADCHCSKIEKKLYGHDGKATEPKKANKKSKEKIEKKPGYNTRFMSNHSKRYVALKVMYFGKRFYGFASEAQMQPTVESEIFQALEEARLLVGDKKESQYSRCGRTDKGVSSVGQVIALFLRSRLKISGVNNGSSGDIVLEEQHGEIDYVRVLNRVLPNDIRILGWCPVPVDFHASYDGNQLWAIKIKGSAFLWHQVRCMVAVLFLVGKGLESPDITDLLLDTNRIPRKPQYTMASEVPLVLQSCEFKDVKFMCSSEAGEALHSHLVNECKIYQLQAAIFHEAILNSVPPLHDQILPAVRESKKKASHIPLMSRPTEPSYEERRAKLNSCT